MNLVWKLLRRHVSVPQFAGFALANLFGTIIVLLGYQFYRDVLPVFTSQDSFFKADYVIVNKKTGAAGMLSGRAGVFTDAEIADVSAQKFVGRVGRFTTADYRVDARMGIGGMSVLSSEIFFESVPDGFVDVSSSEWGYEEGSRDIPIILPRSYINMYNFGFARSRSLPKISDGLLGMIDFSVAISGNGRRDDFRGRVIGFSNRINTILVPQSFMDWSNSVYSSDGHSAPTRLILEVTNPADKAVAGFFDGKGYEVDSDKLETGKTTYFLQMLVTVVMAVGVIISILSFYILMLSIYLLVQKNSTKLENLLLIGYSPLRVASPYLLLTLGLNAAVLVAAIVIVYFVRGYYTTVIETLFPRIEFGSMLGASVLLGLLLFALVSVANLIAIYRKMMRIWWRKDEK